MSTPAVDILLRAVATGAVLGLVVVAILAVASTVRLYFMRRDERRPR